MSRLTGTPVHLETTVAMSSELMGGRLVSMDQALGYWEDNGNRSLHGKIGEGSKLITNDVVDYIRRQR